MSRVKNPEKEREREMLREQRLLKNQEPKKGLMRLIEIIDRDGAKFLKAGTLAVLSLFPFMAVLVMAVAGGAPVFLLGCIPAGMLAAPQICGAADTVMRSLRDEVGWWWWDTYRRSWKQNVKASLLPGGLFGFVIGMQLYDVYAIAGMENPSGEFWTLLIAVLLEFSVLEYYLPMLVCMEMSFGQLLRNCFVLFLNHPIRSVVSAVPQVIYYLVLLTWFPLTSPVMLLFSVWLPMSVTYLSLYPILDRHFDLKAKYQQLQKQKWEE